MTLFTLSLFLACMPLGFSQSVEPPGVTDPIAEDCGDGSGSVICINHYAAVLPYHFNRTVSTPKAQYEFRNTSVPSAPTFPLLSTANFLVFDRERGLELLGPNPTYDFVFHVSDAVHEAPIYAPKQNLLFMSQLAPPAGFLPQLVVNLNDDPPTLSEYEPSPPIYAPNGGTFYDGKLLFGASGGNDSLPGGEQRISLRTVDPATNESTVLLNNYFGFYFNCIDDVAVHPITRDIFFTDPEYSWFNALTDTAPQLPTASYRFNPRTGATFVVDAGLAQPNGIAFTPDGNTLYISDTGAVTGTVAPELGSHGTGYNTTGARTIYAYDVRNNGTQITNKRAFYLAPDWVPDGLKVSAENLVLTGSGKGVDVLDEVGQLLLRVQTNYTVQNFAWVGADLKELWMMGNGGISRVRWNIAGQELI